MRTAKLRRNQLPLTIRVQLDELTKAAILYGMFDQRTNAIRQQLGQDYDRWQRWLRGLEVGYTDPKEATNEYARRSTGAGRGAGPGRAAP